MQPLGGPAEVQLSGDRHERFQLAQLHSQTLPREVSNPQDQSAHTGPARLFGRAE